MHRYAHTHTRKQTFHSVAPVHVPLSCLSNPQKIVFGRSVRCYKNTGKLLDVRFPFFSAFFRMRTVILASYQCSSPALSSWVGRRRCLTLGDRCHVLNTAPDTLAAGHHSSLPPSRRSTRTPRARTRRARRTEGPRSPLQIERG